MDSRFSLGRIAGIPVGVSWSWLVVCGLIVWTLAVDVFPSQNPGLSTSEYVAMGLAATALFYVSLVMHEFGHALRARREGIEIVGITLWLFGGVARFRGDFPSAGSELRVALAGPAVSLAIGVACTGAAVLAPAPSAVDGVVWWLGSINLTLLAFNLLPAFPLDGGRVLRSLLWMARGDLGWATRLAAAVGRAFGMAMAGLGIAVFVAWGLFAGVWLGFLGWFLFAAATAERRHAAARLALANLMVRDLMVRAPITVAPDMLVGDAVQGVANSTRHATYPVVEDGRALGLLELARVGRVPRREWSRRRVRECLLGIDQVPVLWEDEGAADALDELAQSRVQRGLVLDRGRLVGLLSVTDIARALRPPIRPVGGRA
jgi:Zn-dependent protease/CBS domain-containing protein